MCDIYLIKSVYYKIVGSDIVLHRINNKGTAFKCFELTMSLEPSGECF